MGCVPVCVLLARTVCRRRCFIITRRGGPLELGALVAWAVPFDDRGNGTGTPPARDSTVVAPYRFSVVDSIMVKCWGVCGLFCPPRLYFFLIDFFRSFPLSPFSPTQAPPTAITEGKMFKYLCSVIYIQGTSHGVSNPPPLSTGML